MGYAIDLEEHAEQSLEAELERRANLRRRGLCDYCERPHGSNPACKFPERHKAREAYKQEVPPQEGMVHVWNYDGKRVWIHPRDIDSEAQALYQSEAKEYGFHHPPPWERLTALAKELYRSEALRRRTRALPNKS